MTDLIEIKRYSAARLRVIDIGQSLSNNISWKM